MKVSPSLFCAALVALLIHPVLAADPVSATNGGTLFKSVKVAAVGDSITEGIGTPNPALDAYPQLLARMLGAGWAVQNFGVSGATLMNSGNKPYQKEPKFQEALAFNPDIVVIMLGTNDSKPVCWSHRADFIRDYKDLIGKFKALPNPKKFFLCRPPFVVGKGAFGINEEAVRQELPRISQIAQDEGAQVIDTHGALENKPALSTDTVHPNLAGALVLAKTVYKALTGHEYTGPDPTAQ